MTTANPTAPLTLPVLYSDDYGFHNGVQLFRGRFDGDDATGVNLTVQGGVSSGFSAYLNGAFLGAWTGNTADPSGTLVLSFNTIPLTSTNNVVTVVMDHSGHDELTSALNPRGILGASLISPTKTSTFTKWTLAGNAGGEDNSVDPIRGTIAEGGLHAERLGWHLPGFDDSAWVAGSPSDGVENATIAFYRSSVDINVPEGFDASIEFVLGASAGSLLRAQLYVNGYQYGKFVPQVGHQIAFPVHPGILNYRGSNTIGFNLWSQSAAGAQVDVSMNVLGVYESAFDPGFDASALQPGWSEKRLQFA